MDGSPRNAPADPAGACTVTEHALVFLLDFPCARVTQLPRKDPVPPRLIDPAGTVGILHPMQREPAPRPRALFEAGEIDLSGDLHMAARAAFTDGRTEEAAAALPCRSLTEYGRRLLNGELARPPGDPRQQSGFVTGRGLALLLGHDSRARIVAAGAPDAAFLRLQIDALDVLGFGSETGVAMLRLRVTPSGPVRLAQLQEALHALGNAARARSIGWACEAEPAGRFTLLDLADCALKAAGSGAARWNRLFTSSYAQLADHPAGDGTIAADAGAGLATAAWRLSRHYTAAYQPGPDHLVGSVLFRPFRDVVHAVSLEGVASLTVPESTFMQEGFTARVRSCYVPLAVLAFHEHVQLLTMAQLAPGAMARRSAADTGDGKALQALIEAFLNFRLRYRLAVVSDITMHNQFYAAVRTGLQIDALTQKLAGDTADAARALQARHARAEAERGRLRHAAHLQRERKRAWVLGLFAGLLTFLTSLAALRELRELLVEPMHPPDWLHPQTIAAGLAVLLAVFSGVVTARRHSDAHTSGAGEEDEIGDELLVDLQGEGAHVATEVPAAPSAVAATVVQDSP